MRRQGLTVADIVCVRLDWDRTAVPQRIAREFYTVRVAPEPGHPLGRKGLALAGAWAQLGARSAAGMLILDGDVVIDPQDYDAMMGAVHGDPRCVHTAPVRIWPASTKRESWVWAHWASAPSQVIEQDPAWFSFCFTYLPRSLVTAALARGLASWAYPGVDKRMSEAARLAGIRARVVPGCWPTHLNY